MKSFSIIIPNQILLSGPKESNETLVPQITHIRIYSESIYHWQNFGPIFEQNAIINFEPIFEKSVYSEISNILSMVDELTKGQHDIF